MKDMTKLEELLEQFNTHDAALVRIAELEAALREVRFLAVNEQDYPSGLHMTCLSMIQKAADAALAQ